jgi:hypothetical protein
MFLGFLCKEECLVIFVVIKQFKIFAASIVSRNSATD